jgi:hypothetical protein
MLEFIKKLFVKHTLCDCEEGKTAYWTIGAWENYYLCQNCGQIWK